VRILNVMQCTNLGGMEQASLRLMQGLRERGHAIRVVSVNPVGNLGPLLERSGIPAAGVPFAGRFGWRGHRLLRKAIRSAACDGLLVTGPTLSGILALGRVCRGRRVLAVHFHHEGVKPRWQWRRLYAFVAKRFQAVTFPSDFIRREAESICPAIGPIAHTVPNPLLIPPESTPQDRAAARQALGLPPSAPVIGNAGWLIPRKRFDVFLHVAALVRQSLPDAIFLIAGDGPESGRLRALAEKLGIGPSVRWLGWQQEMGLFYRSLDVLVFNSDWDAVGLTPLEAASYGVPVVASVENGGLGEILDRNNCGFVLPVHDVPMLAHRAALFLTDGEFARKVGRAGRARVAEVCSMARCVEAHESLLGVGRG